MKVTNEAHGIPSALIGNLGGDVGDPEGTTPPPDCCDIDPTDAIDRAADVGVSQIFRDPTGSGALTLVQSDDSYGGLGGVVTANFPGATTSGNLLVAAFSIRSHTAGESITPGVWTQVAIVDSVASNSGQAIVWYKEADGTETSVTVQGVNNYDRLTIMEFDGIGTLVDLAVVDDDATSATTVAVPAVTVTESTALVVGIAHQSREPSTLGAVELTEIGQGKAGNAFGPTDIVGYLNPGAAGSYDWNPTSNVADTWAAILTAFQISGTGDWVTGGQTMIDGDDATYDEIDGANIIRVDLGAAFPITGVRLLVGPFTAGSKTYTLTADSDPDFGSPVTVATLGITAAGAYATSDVSAVFPPETYEFWQLTGPDEVARFFSLELLQGAVATDLALDDLIDVDTSGVGDGDVLTFDSATGTWIADAPGAGSLTDHTHAATGSGANGGGATLSPGVLNLPAANTPAQTTDGSVVWDSDDDVLTIGTGAARKTFGYEGTTAPSTQAFGDSATAGTSHETAHVDHKHAMPANPVPSFATTSDIADVSATENAGAASTVPRGDHVHRLAITTTRGDIIRRGATDNERYGLGTDGYLLASDGTDVVWEPQYADIIGFIDGGTTTPATSTTHCWAKVDFACTITEATIIADASGDAVVDIKKRAYGGGAASSICSGTKPTLSGQQENTDTSLSSWTVAISAGDVVYFVLDSVTTCKRIMVALKVRRT